MDDGGTVQDWSDGEIIQQVISYSVDLAPTEELQARTKEKMWWF